MFPPCSLWSKPKLCLSLQNTNSRTALNTLQIGLGNPRWRGGIHVTVQSSNWATLYDTHPHHMNQNSTLQNTIQQYETFTKVTGSVHFISKYYINRTKYGDSNGNAFDLNSGGIWFEFWFVPLWFSSVSGKFQGSILHYETTTSYHILSNLLVTIIQSYDITQSEAVIMC